MTDIDFSRLKILIIDDNDFVRFMLKKYLSEYGIVEILEAANGMEGLNMLFGTPDIIVCDINMEPLNGFEFLKHVRAMADGAGKVPVIFLTGNANLEFVQKALDLSVDAYILKPFTSDNLRSKIVTLLNRNSPAPPPNETRK